MDIIRQGEVNSIDVKKGKARVIFFDRDDKVSDWLNILVPFSDSHYDNSNLSVGQSVLVLSLPNMSEIGYILGCPMRPSNISEGEVKRTFSDGGFYSYLNGTLTLNPVSEVVINADVTINGNLDITGTSSAEDHLSSGISGKNHKHSGVTSGSDVSGGPV